LGTSRGNLDQNSGTLKPGKGPSHPPPVSSYGFAKARERGRFAPASWGADFSVDEGEDTPRLIRGMRKEINFLRNIPADAGGNRPRSRAPTKVEEKCQSEEKGLHAR